MENPRCADEGPYPDHDAGDAETYPDQNFHSGSVVLIAGKGHARDGVLWLAVALMSFPVDYQSPRSDRANHYGPLS